MGGCIIVDEYKPEEDPSIEIYEHAAMNLSIRFPLKSTRIILYLMTHVNSQSLTASEKRIKMAEIMNSIR